MHHLLFFALLTAPVPAQMLMMGEASEGFVSLFNGRDIDQWDGDPRLWKVERNVIAGSTDGVDPLQSNSFLTFKARRYRDFELRLDIRLRNHTSGVQFRSEEGPGWAVRGPKAAAPDGKAFRPGDWNEYSILCRGGAIRVTVNAAVTVERTGDTPRDGVIALQISAGVPMRVEFRNVRIKTLD